MARSRNIKPGLYKNVELADAPVGARYLFTGLWCIADREGRLKDSPKWIKAEIFPYDSDISIAQVHAWLQDLHGSKCIERYSVGGENYIQVVNFLKHQNPHHKEKPSDIPAPPPKSPELAPDKSRASIGQDLDKSGTSPGQVSDKSGTSPELAPTLPQPCPILAGMNHESMNHESVNEESGFPQTPAPDKSGSGLVVQIPQSREPPKQDLFDVFWRLFVMAGKAMNDVDKEKALRLWLNYEQPQQEEIIRWTVEQMKTVWSDAMHTPMPASALNSKGWTRNAAPRVIPTPGKQSKASEVLRIVQERYDETGRPRIR